MKIFNFITVVFLLLITAVSNPSHAQRYANYNEISENSTAITFHVSSLSASSLDAFAGKKTMDESQWKQIKAAGIITTSVGAASILTGIGSIINGKKKANNIREPLFNERLGKKAIIVGAALIAGGVPSWVIAKRKLDGFKSVSFNASPSFMKVAFNF